MNQYYSIASRREDESVLLKNKKVSKKIEHILGGGYESISYAGYPTGLIKVSPVEIAKIANTTAQNASSRLQYVQRTAQAQYLSETPKALLHLNSYKKVESSEDFFGRN